MGGLSLETEMNNITMVDHFGRTRTTIQVSVPSLELTLRDLITLRVKAELSRIQSQSASSLVITQITNREKNMRTTSLFQWIDGTSIGTLPLETQIDRAHEAFVKSRFFVFMGKNQLKDLDTQISLEPQSTIRFLSILPLAGG